jgi:CubicO group peptidase (beta-lactamase class C family)
MSILLLQRDGKLSLDDPIRKLFPEMPAYADGITWRRALSQTSGLRDLWTLWGQTGRTFRGDTIDALQVITRSAGTNYAPGDRYLYTNSGWILAAQAVYRLTGKSLAQFAESRIFAPLGMRDTRYFGDNAMVIPGLATAYSPQTSGGFRVARNTYDGAIVGAGGVHTTIEDFGRWLDNYDRLLVGDAAIVRTMTTPTALSNGSPARVSYTQAYAVGLNAGTFRGLPWCRTAGAGPATAGTSCASPSSGSPWRPSATSPTPAPTRSRGRWRVSTSATGWRRTRWAPGWRRSTRRRRQRSRPPSGRPSQGSGATLRAGWCSASAWRGTRSSRWAGSGPA